MTSTPTAVSTLNYQQADCLRDNLYRGDQVVLLDCRGNEEYRRGHIQGAYNIVLPQIMLRRLKTNKLPLKNLVPPYLKQDKDAFLSRISTSSVVVYDQYSSEVNDNESSLPILLHNRLTREGCRVAILKGRTFVYAFTMLVIVRILQRSVLFHFAVAYVSVDFDSATFVIIYFSHCAFEIPCNLVSGDWFTGLSGFKCCRGTTKCFSIWLVSPHSIVERYYAAADRDHCVRWSSFSQCSTFLITLRQNLSKYLRLSVCWNWWIRDFLFLKLKLNRANDALSLPSYDRSNAVVYIVIHRFTVVCCIVTQTGRITLAPKLSKLYLRLFQVPVLIERRLF